MPYSTPNRQNYRMRPNYTPPPIRNPYLSYQELQKKAQAYKPTTFPTVEEISSLVAQATEQPPMRDNTQPMRDNMQPPMRDNMQPPTTTFPTNPPLPLSFPKSNLTDKDIAYINHMFPEDIRLILEEIKKHFDRLDYEGSFIFDEYPDRTTLIRLSEDIYNSLLPLTHDFEPEEPPRMQEDRQRTPGLLPKNDSKLWMLYVILILVYSELLSRRRAKNETT